MSAGTSRVDQPISDPKQDLLDRGDLVESIANSLVHRERDENGDLIECKATGLVVGLTGPWGSGKSSILNLVHETLSREARVIPVKFNPWIFKDKDDLLNRFFEALHDGLGKKNLDDARSLVADVGRYWQTLEPFVAAGAELAGFGSVAKIAKTVGDGAVAWSSTKKARSSQPEQAKQALENAIAFSKCAIVVLIDELDRVEDHDVREIAKLVKAVGDLRGISYLVAYDLERVAEALGGGSSEAQRKRGEAYLEKIIHHTIPIRPLFERDIDLLVNSVLRVDSGTLLPKPNERQTKILEFLKRDIKTPRDIIRLEGAFAVLNNAANEELCRYDLLAYCWIMTKAPSLQKLIAERYERLVDDPSAVEFSRRMMLEVRKEPMVIDKEIGAEATLYSELLVLLFPRLGTQQHKDNDDRTRLCVRTNIRRVLYLGYPPDVLRRDTLVTIWNTGSFDDLTAHTKLPLIESLPVLFERLEDVMQTLDEGRDETFWNALAQVLNRPVEWGSGREVLPGLVEQAAALLGRFANTNPECRERGRKILATLRLSGELALLPRVVRTHISRFGKRKGGKPRLDRPQIWDEREFESILLAELDRYRDYVCSDDFLVNAFSFEAGFVLLDMGRFGKLERSSMTNRLVDVQSTSSFAALLIPPGYSVEPSALAEVIDVEAFRERVSTFAHHNTWALDDYRKLSARRLIALAKGRDPMWLEDDDDLAPPAQEPG